MRITWEACESSVGPTPDFLIQQVWGGDQEFAFLTSSYGPDAAGLRATL